MNKSHEGPCRPRFAFRSPLKYDRSGRSTGVAIVTYETPEDASRAIARFNGATANGFCVTPFTPCYRLTLNRSNDDGRICPNPHKAQASCRERTNVTN